MEWLEELDRDLSVLREAEARLYHQADLGGRLDAERLKDIARRRRELLSRPEIAAKADALSAESSDPVARRKAELLRLEVMMTGIEDAPELLAIRHELEQAQQDFSDRMKTREGMRCYLKATERAARARIVIANRAARRQGLRSYAEAKLTWQELSVAGLLKTLAHVRRTCRQDFRNAVDGCDAAGLSPAELDRAVAESLAYLEEAFPREGLGDAAGRTLAPCGESLEALPIRAEVGAVPCPGAVHALKIGRDIRLVMRPTKGGLANYAAFFHELGHALYYVHAPDSVLLLDSRIGREGLAELWAGLMERREWLRRFSCLKDDQITELLARRRRFHAFRAMTFVREALFELELYRNPQADFLDTWNGVTRECLGVANREEVYSEFVFLYPLDIKDYVYAHLIRESVIGELESRWGHDLLSPEVFEFIVAQYYRTGNLRPWHRRFAGFDAGGAFSGRFRGSPSPRGCPGRR